MRCVLTVGSFTSLSSNFAVPSATAPVVLIARGDTAKNTGMSVLSAFTARLWNRRVDGGASNLERQHRSRRASSGREDVLGGGRSHGALSFAAREGSCAGRTTHCSQRHR